MHAFLSLVPALVYADDMLVMRKSEDQLKIMIESVNGRTINFVMNVFNVNMADERMKRKCNCLFGLLVFERCIDI